MLLDGASIHLSCLNESLTSEYLCTLKIGFFAGFSNTFVFVWNVRGGARALPNDYK